MKQIEDMGSMRYKPSDKVRIKSLDWYNENKDEDGIVELSTHIFTPGMSQFCGKVVTIEDVFEDIDDNVVYYIEEIDYDWTDEMIEGLVEEETKNNNDMEEKETLLGWVKENDSLRLVPHKDYEIKHDGDNFYLVKKKKEYPKTYEECCELLGKTKAYQSVSGYKTELLEYLQKLIICRDAYWKIAGDEMELGEPWEPNWKNSEMKYTISFEEDEYTPYRTFSVNCPFAFPTEEMRDAFYENFKSEIESCKELL
jgi:hypothetical protein